jgi:hypothetical protein
LLAALALGSAQPAHAQDSKLSWRLHAGIAQPLASTAKYFAFGPSLGFDVRHPIKKKLSIGLDVDWDYLNTDVLYPTPVTNLWRYRAELEGNLAGDQENGRVFLSALGGVGGTTFHSHKFWLTSRPQDYNFDGDRLTQTSVTGTAGLRLGFRSPDGITWWLTGKLNVTPMNQFNKDALRELAKNKLDPLGSAMNAGIQLGVSL